MLNEFCVQVVNIMCKLFTTCTYIRLWFFCNKNEVINVCFVFLVFEIWDLITAPQLHDANKSTCDSSLWSLRFFFPLLKVVKSSSVIP